MGKGCTNRDEPYRESRKQIKVEPKHDLIECAMNSAMQSAKYHEHPRSIDIYPIYLLCGEKIENDRVKNYWHLEQVLEIIRGIRDAWGRNLRKSDRGKLLRAHLSTLNKTDPANIHINPNNECQQYCCEERAKDCVLSHFHLLNWLRVRALITLGCGAINISMG